MSLFSGMKLTANKKPAQSISAKVQDGKTSKKPPSSGSASGQSFGHPTHSPQVKETDGTNVEGVSNDSLKLKDEGSPSKELSKDANVSEAASDGRTGEGKSMFSFITETDKINTQFGRIREDDHEGKESVSDNLELDPFSVGLPSRKGQISDSLKLSLDLEGLDLSSVSLSPDEERSHLTKLPAGCDDDEEDDKATCTVGNDKVVEKENTEDNQRWLDLELEEDQDVGYSPINFDADVTKASEESTDEQKEDPGNVYKEPQYDFELSLKDTLEVSQQMHAAKLRHISEALNELASQISATSSNCLRTSSNLLHKQQMLMKIQQRQSEAVAREDYEEAESVHKQSESLELELQHMPMHAIPSNHPVILDIIGTIRKLQDEEKTCRDEHLRDLNEMREKQEVFVEEVKGQYVTFEISEKCLLEEEESNLQREVGHLNLDKEHLDRKEKHLEKRIDDKTANLREEREQLCERRKTVQDDIKELEKKLAFLKKEENELSNAITHQEDLIVQAKEEFVDEMHALEEERSKVNGKDANVKLRQGKLQEKQEGISCRLADSKAKVTREESILVLISETIRRYGEDLVETREADSIPPASLKLEENHQHIDSLREKLKTTSESVQSVTAEVLQTQTKVVSLRQKVSDTEGHIAALTEAKQLAVSGRNFAEAKRLANSIKELTSEGQKCQDELERLIGINEKKNKELKQLQKDINQTKEELLKEEQSYDSNLKTSLLQHIQELQQAYEKKDNKHVLFRTIHETDIKSCAMLIQYLCIKHGESVPDAIQEHLVQGTEDDGIEAEDAGKSANEELSKVTKESVPSSVDSTADTQSTVYNKIEALEAQLQAAVDEEDYDTAQLLQEEIEDLQRSAKPKE